jgi:hypothetical protein
MKAICHGIVFAFAAKISAVSLVLISGCAPKYQPEQVIFSPAIPAASEVPSFNRNPADDPEPHYSIFIESKPPGAAIEFNGAYMGQTPCRIRVPGEKGRTFGYGKMLNHTITATPGASGGYTQFKKFNKGEPIPERIFFNMLLIYR